MDYEGDFLIASVQKFLIEKDKDEDVTELAPSFGYLSVPERATGLPLPLSIPLIQKFLAGKSKRG